MDLDAGEAWSKWTLDLEAVVGALSIPMRNAAAILIHIHPHRAAALGDWDVFPIGHVARERAAEVPAIGIVTMANIGHSLGKSVLSISTFSCVSFTRIGRV